MRGGNASRERLRTWFAVRYDAGRTERPRCRMNPSPVPPVVRHFLPCLGVKCDTLERPTRYTLDGPVFAIHPPFNYPYRQEELWLFCQFSDATGLMEFVVDLSFDVDTRVTELRTFRVDFGADRLAVRNYTLRLARVPFRRAGVYEFRLRRETAELARAAIRLEDVT
jgi:hypothetical protein